MSLNRYAARRDGNENELVTALRALGALWVQEGPLDGWAFWRGAWIPVEIKTAKGKYTESQVQFLIRCQERQAPVWTWRNLGDVYRCLGAKVSA